MRQVTATEKYRAVNEGKLAKGAFVRDMRMAHPSIISQWNSYDDTVQILKNKGFISEKSNVDSYDSRFELNISSDSIDRGVRYELQAKGIDPTNANQEDFDGVKNKVIKNLKKDPLHYILLVSGESNKVDKNDKPKEVKRGAADKDTFNDLKKATLKEGYTEEQINAAIQRLKEKKNLANEASQEESVADYIIKHYTNPKTGKSLVDDEIVSDFFKTHPEWEDMADGSDDGMKDLLHNFGEYLDANYEGASDMDEKRIRVKKEGSVADFAPSPNSDVMDANAEEYDVATAFKKARVDMSKPVTVIHSYGHAQYANSDKDEMSAEAAIKKLEAERQDRSKQYTDDGMEVPEDHHGYEFENYSVLEEEMPEGHEYKLAYFQTGDADYAITQEKSNIRKEGYADYEPGTIAPEDLYYSDKHGKLVALDDVDDKYWDRLELVYKKGDRIEDPMDEEKKELPKSIADKERDQIEKDAKKAKGMIKEKLTEVEAIQVGIDKGYSNEQIAAAISKLKGNQVTAEEKKTIDLYDDGDVVVDISRATPEQERLINYEFEISEFGDSEEAQEVADELMNLNSADDVENYYADERGWDQDPDMRSSIRAAVDIFRGLDEKKGKDHDGDGDIDGDDYMAAKDKAIKKAMGKDKVVRESLKNIITKVLEEQTINEAATNHLAGLADTYGDFEGFKQSIIQLQDIVTDIESYYDKTRSKIQKVYDSIADIRNDEGLKVGAFLAPSIEAAFNKDLRPVSKAGFTKGLETPKVKVLKKDDLNAGSMYEEEPKQSVFTPINEGFTVVGPDKEKNAKELADIAKKLGLTSQIYRSPSGDISDIEIRTADGKNMQHHEIPQEFLDAHGKQMDNAPDEGPTVKPGKKLKKLTKGGITYEVGKEDPEDEGRITSIDKYSNGYFISGVVYGDDDGDEYEREGYGYAIDLDGEKMDEEELKGRF